MLAKWFGAQPHQRGQATVWGQWAGDVEPTWAGMGVDHRSAPSLLTVYACTRFICDGISTLPVDVYRKDAAGNRLEVSAPAWLLEPMPGVDFTEWCGQVLWSLLIAGNAYLAVYLDGAGSVVGLEPLDPDQVDVRVEAGRKVFYVAGRRTTLPIRHLKAVAKPGDLLGSSPVEAARQSIGLGMAAQRYGARFFDHDGQMPGVIELPAGKTLPPDKAKALAEMWARKLSKANRSKLPGVLDDGATWKATTITNEAAEFLATRKFTAAEIAGQMFLLDPSDLGIPVEGTSLTYANLEQRNIRRVQVTFMPWIVRLERFLSDLLARPRYVKFNVDAYIRGDTLSRYQAHQIGLTAQFLTVGEVRDMEDLPPLPEPVAPADPTLEVAPQ